MDEYSSTYKIGIIGPSRVGKTSLLSSLLKDTGRALAGTSISLRPADQATRRRIQSHNQDLDGSLRAGEFDSQKLEGTSEKFIFKFCLDPGIESIPGINLEFLDYPGGLTDPAQLENHPEQEKQWKECLEFIKESSVVLVPVDAPILMEASEAEHKRVGHSLLMTEQTKEIVETWAKIQKRKSESSTLLVFCPLKCESYFIDDNGSKNTPDELWNCVTDVYRETINSARKENSNLEILYAPVDTIGCVSLVRAAWTPSQDPRIRFDFSAKYRVREPGERQILGADDVMTALFKNLLRKIEQDRGRRVQVAQEQYDENPGIFRTILWWITRTQNPRELVLQNEKQIAEEFAHKLDELANRPHGERVRSFSS